MNSRIKQGAGAALLTLLASMTALPLASAQDELRIVDKATEDMEVALKTESQVRWEPGQIIVKFREGAEPGAGPQIEAMGMGDVDLQRTSGGELLFTLDMATMSAEESTQSAVRTAKVLSQRDDVEYAQVNYIVEIAAEPIDPGYAQQWHYRNNGSGANESEGGINMPQAWDITTGDAGVIVAVIDTGILPNHSDITGSANQLGGFDMITSTFTSQDGDGRDSDPTDEGDAVAAGECPPLFINPPRGNSWHGTHVAGTVGVVNSNNNTGVAGVSWNGGVVSVRVLGKCGGNVGDINDAIRWAAGMTVPGVPDNTNPARVINMSLGAPIPCTNSPATQAAISDVVGMGVTVVVAAGNDARNAANAMPASCNGVITVAAGDENGDLVTRYSNFGPLVDILAPGGDTQGGSGVSGGVLSTVQGGYAFFNGTSMASPHVAGVAALMLSVDPTLTPQDIEDALENSAMPRTAAQCPEPCGAGLLDARAALGRPSTTLDVNPKDIDMDNGDTQQVVANVSTGGSGVDGVDVRFTSSDTSILTVEPATQTTGAAGNATGDATATIKALRKGSAEITVETLGSTTTVPVTVDVTVVSLLTGMMLALLLIAVGLLYARRMRSATSA